MTLKTTLAISGAVATLSCAIILILKASAAFHAFAAHGLVQ